MNDLKVNFDEIEGKPCGGSADGDVGEAPVGRENLLFPKRLVVKFVSLGTPVIVW